MIIDNSIEIIILNLGNKIQRCRKSLKLTQDEFGFILGVEKLTVARWESGERECKGPALKLVNFLTEHNLWQNEIDKIKNNDNIKLST